LSSDVIPTIVSISTIFCQTSLGKLIDKALNPTLESITARTELGTRRIEETMSLQLSVSRKMKLSFHFPDNTKN
jgi:hypothetical protein